jgi:hypothetical protein
MKAEEKDVNRKVEKDSPFSSVDVAEQQPSSSNFMVPSIPRGLWKLEGRPRSLRPQASVGRADGGQGRAEAEPSIPRSQAFNAAKRIG